MANLVLINPLEVPEGRDDEFIESWKAVRDFVSRRKGFVSTALHRSLNPKARFRFVNVALWDTSEDFRAAIGSEEFRELRKDFPFCAYRELYEVIHE